MVSRTRCGLIPVGEGGVSVVKTGGGVDDCVHAIPTAPVVKQPKGVEREEGSVDGGAKGVKFGSSIHTSSFVGKKIRQSRKPAQKPTPNRIIGCS